MKVTEVPIPGKLRQILAFELRMNIIADATIDLLFTKNRVNKYKLEAWEISTSCCNTFYLLLNFLINNISYNLFLEVLKIVQYRKP